jgi:quinol monooxygenase YgiN
MEAKDSYCRIVAVSKVHSGKLEAFKELCQKFVEKTGREPKCLYHESSFNGDQTY